MDKGTACNELIIIIINYYTYVYWYLLIHSIDEELKEMNNKEDRYAIVVFSDGSPGKKCKKNIRGYFQIRELFSYAVTTGNFRALTAFFTLCSWHRLVDHSYARTEDVLVSPLHRLK